MGRGYWGEVTYFDVLRASERVVVFAGAERVAVDVGCEVAYRGADARV